MIQKAMANAGFGETFMSKLIVVRHGQASFHGDDYDQLSDVGREQSHALGSWWARLGIHWDHIFVGPRKRHRQTADAVAQAYTEAGIPLPEFRSIPELDEHQGTEVVKHVMVGEREGNNLLPKGVSGGKAVRHYFHHFQTITRRWIEGEHDELGYEPWAAFRDRVRQGIAKMTDLGSGKTVAAFTSGGPVAVSAGLALNLSDLQILELSWNIRNAAFNEFLFSERGFSPVSFNALPHLDRKKWHTLV
ncbi:MAG: histidine phosphatase family protein [Acidobacteriota bacterium]|nr:histidine phosphatase family protein [Acidobacteriota bacterium]